MSGSCRREFQHEMRKSAEPSNVLGAAADARSPSFSGNGNAPVCAFRWMLALLAQSGEPLDLVAANNLDFHVQPPWQSRNRMGNHPADTIGRLLRVGLNGRLGAFPTIGVFRQFKPLIALLGCAFLALYFT